MAGVEIANYDRKRPVVMTYSTYLGGTGHDSATAVTVDASGNAYVAGWTESADFPGLAGIRLGAPNGVDAYIAKLSPAGHLLYVTYIGGSGDDRAFGIAVDGAGCAIIAGWTYSTNFPVLNAAQPKLGGARDGFVLKLNATGNGLIFGTYLGGSANDSSNAVTVDPVNNIYVAGETASTNFPVSNGFQIQPGGGVDAFIAKFSSSGARLYGTFLGGVADDRATAIAVDSSGHAYITGSTYSPDFPTLNPLQNAIRGAEDAFAAKIGPGGDLLLYSTYIGGSGGTLGAPETGNAIFVDSMGCAYIGGATSSPDFPIVNAFQTSLSGSQDAFVLKLSATGGALVYSTYLGGSSIDAATALAVDTSGRAYIAGYTASTDFPVANAAQSSANGGGYDAFVVRLSAAGNTVEMASYLGGSGSDSAYGIALDASGNVYVAGQTMSINFPISSATQPYDPSAASTFLASLPGAGEALRFVPLSPCRIADTRNPIGPFGGPLIASKASRDFVIRSTCGIPATAQAYSLNVTAVPTRTLGYLTIWPSGQPQPAVSTLNSLDGRIKAAAVIVAAGNGGNVTIYASDASNVVIDINGYFVPATDPGALAFFPISPCRLADTRNSPGPLGGPSLPAGVSRSFPVLSSNCGIPASAQAYALNFTVVPRGSLGFLSTWPTGTAQPGVSTLNALTGTIVANAAIVPAGMNGSIDVIATNNTDLLIDINGYFATPNMAGLSLYPLPPCRVFDSRLSGPVGLSGANNIPITGSSCNIPSSTQAFVLNATVVPPGPLGFLTLWPLGQAQPGVSTLNALDGTITSNLALIPTTNGSISAYLSQASHLLLDVSGYFAP
jgi:hypothetical protein